MLLVDGSSWLYRAFHALPPLTTGAGEPTGAIYGMGNMLRKLLREYQPEHIAVIFDPRGPTFRNELYADYKANRPPVPEELAAQFDTMLELITALGLKLIQVEGVEADDVIGTLTKRWAGAEQAVLIVTRDKDMAQLVNDDVRLLDTMRDKITDSGGVQKKFGVGPEHVRDWLALAGDTSDNIPGVDKVGPKTAAKWLNQYGGLDAVMEHASEIKGKVGDNLRAALEQLPLSRKLATIKLDVALEMETEDLRPGQPDYATLGELAQRLEFQGWLRDFNSEADAGSSGQEAINTQHTLVDSEQALDELYQRLGAAELVCLDTETDNLDAIEARLVGLSFAVAPGEAWYVPVAHNYPGAPAQLSLETVLDRLKPLLEDLSRPKLGQNLKYDVNVLANHGVRLTGVTHDTMLESYVLDSTATRHDMDSLALKYLGHTTIKFADVAGKGAKQVTFDKVALEEAAPYAAEDADITLRLHQRLWPRIEEKARLAELYRDIEIPLMPVLAGMERTGVLVDRDFLEKLSREMAETLGELEEKATREAGGVFNLNSPAQLQEILFERLGLPAQRRTAKGQPSTAEDVLEKLAGQHPLPALILEYRGVAKLRSTYAQRLPEQINPRTGRVHTSYHQSVAATGRLSSSDPNLQNIPIRTAAGRRIRQAFIAPPGASWFRWTTRKSSCASWPTCPATRA
jgi:DNA polymerase-1